MQMNAADILKYIQNHWKDGYKQFPNLKGLSPAQAPARLPAKDERYKMEKKGSIKVLKEVR